MPMIRNEGVACSSHASGTTPLTIPNCIIPYPNALCCNREQSANCVAAICRGATRAVVTRWLQVQKLENSPKGRVHTRRVALLSSHSTS